MTIGVDTLASHMAGNLKLRWRVMLLAISILIGVLAQFGGLGFTAPRAAAATPTSVNAGVALRHTGPGGYSVTRDGTVTPFGGAPSLAGTGVVMWPGGNIVRGIALRSDDLGGYVLDLYGGIHPFGNAPALGGGPYWGGWDIARGIVLRSDNAGGYVMDGYGGIHPFGNAPALGGGPYWGGWDIARSIALLGNGSGGYILDGWGGIHTFGNAPALYDSAYWPSSDVARGIAVNPGGTSGVMIDAYGGLHPATTSPLNGDGPYSVVGTGSSGLTEHSAPSTAGVVTGTLPNGTAVYIACQTSGTSYATGGSPATDTIWDQLTSGLYVADYWMSTPAVGTFTSGIPQCSVTPPVPFTGGASGSGSGVSCGNFAHTFEYGVSGIGLKSIAFYDISIWATLCSNGANLYVSGTPHCSASYPITDEYTQYWCGSVTNSSNSLQLGANGCGESGLHIGSFGEIAHADYWPRWTLTLLGNGQVGEAGFSGETDSGGGCSSFS